MKHHCSIRWLARSMLLAALLAGGCASVERNAIEPGYRVPALHGNASDSLTGAFIRLHRNERGQIDPSAGVFNELYARATENVAPDTPEAERAQRARNELIAQTMAVSDDLVERHKALILGNYAMTNASLGILTTATSSLAAVFSPTGTKSALSASSAIFNSSRATVNEAVFLNQIATTIVGAIDRERRKLRGVIEEKMTLSVAVYPLAAAFLDLQSYHDAGSFSHGLVVVSESLSKQRETVPEIESRIGKLKEQYTAATQELTAATSAGAPAQADAATAVSLLKAQLDLLRGQLSSAPAQ